MNRLEIAGAIGADNLPDGSYVATLWTGIRTQNGLVPAQPEALLYPRLAPSGQVFCGQGQGSGTALEWNGTSWVNRGKTFGVNPVIYTPDGALRLATVTDGSQGYRYINDAGGIVSGDESINSSTGLARSYGLTGFYEWTHLGDVTTGQGEAACIVQVGNGPHRVLEPGGCFDIRFSRIGNACAVAMIKRAENKAVFLWFDASELDSLPLEKQEPPPPPPPPPPPDDEPEKPIVSFTYDTGPLNTHAQVRWAVLPHATREQQAAALFRLLYEFNQPEVEVFRKGTGGTHFLGSDGYGYAEDICVIVQPNGKWWKDVGVAFGSDAARLDFGQGWQLTDQPQNCYPPPYPDGDIPPVDEPPPLDPSISARLAALEAEHSLLAGRVTALENSVPEPAPIPLPDDVVRTSTHEVKASVRYLGTVTGQIVKKG
jgi:hypothetical protein